MAGFRSLDEEVTDVELPLEGAIPQWLDGTLLRNGPGSFEVDGERVGHWFDGLAMLRRYRVTDGAVRYSNRFLRSEAYADARDGHLTGQFGTGDGPVGRVLETVRNLGPPEPTDNANVHVARICGEPVALTEVPRWVGFDATTLETGEELVFADDLDLDMTTAHLTADPHRDELVGFGASFGRKHEYVVYRIGCGQPPSARSNPGAPGRERIATIPTETPAYIHDCGLTAERVVLVETPLRISIRRALSPFTEGFQDMLSWQSDCDTRFIVVDRETGTREEWTTGGFFTFHVVNAFEDGEELVVDLVAFDDAGIVDALSFDSLAGADFDDVPPGRLDRYRLGPDGVSRERFYRAGMELPVVARPVRTREHRYVYAQATGRAGANGLVKVDTRTGESREWWSDGTYLEEPRIVQRPGAEAEDDGIVLAPAIDATGERSILLVFDATDLSELARAVLPHQLPFGFHGRFFPTA
jgi:carotenoid cleavage dioxygenase-like enzyme